MDDRKNRVNRNCLHNDDPTKPRNQQTLITDSELNNLVMKIGSENHNLATPVEIDKAIVMQTQLDQQHVVLKNSFDVGLIFPNKRLLCNNAGFKKIKKELPYWLLLPDR